MGANNIVLWFSVIVFVIVALWAVWLVREFDKAAKG
jgi:hypothetical protein